MTQDEAVDILITAAESWSNELGEYIIPADEDSEDPDAIETTENRRKQQDDIDEAVKVLSPGITGVETEHWFPMDLIERRVEVDGKMKSTYGQIVQAEHTRGVVTLWVALPGTNKPERWPAAQCRLLRRG